MGYDTYTVSKTTGVVVAAWIGTGTDVGKQVTMRFNKGTPRSVTSYKVKALFCETYGKMCATLGKKLCYNERCPPPKAQPRDFGGVKPLFPEKTTKGGNTDPCKACGQYDYLCHITCRIDKLGDNLGKSITDALRSFSEQSSKAGQKTGDIFSENMLPIIGLGIGAVVLIVLLK